MELKNTKTWKVSVQSLNHFHYHWRLSNVFRISPSKNVILKKKKEEFSNNFGFAVQANLYNFREISDAKTKNFRRKKSKIFGWKSGWKIEKKIWMKIEKNIARVKIFQANNNRNRKI